MPDNDPGERAARLVAELVAAKPHACLGLPTGRTPRQCYRLLSQWSADGELDWSRVRCFSLDEYIGAPDEQTFKHYLSRKLYKNCNVDAGNLFSPADYIDFDGLIAGCGGLDLILLGLGGNGHIAFNEPGTPLESWTHCAWLSESTRKANQEFFGSLDAVPVHAVTMGLRTILSSRRVLLLVSGAAKREILIKALRGPVGSDVPASFLQMHPALEVVTDFDY